MSSSETPSALHHQGHDVSWRMEGNEVLSQTDLRSSPYGKTQNANGLVTADTRGIFAQYGSGLRGAHEGLMQSGLGPQVAHDGPEPGLYANKSYSSLPPSIFGAKPAAGAGGGWQSLRRGCMGSCRPEASQASHRSIWHCRDDVVMAHIVMAYIGMACMVMA